MQQIIKLINRIALRMIIKITKIIMLKIINKKLKMKVKRN